MGTRAGDKDTEKVSFIINHFVGPTELSEAVRSTLLYIGLELEFAICLPGVKRHLYDETPLTSSVR